MLDIEEHWEIVLVLCWLCCGFRGLVTKSKTVSGLMAQNSLRPKHLNLSLQLSWQTISFFFNGVLKSTEYHRYRVYRVHSTNV